jgi:hypothetical protein
MAATISLSVDLHAILLTYPADSDNIALLLLSAVLILNTSALSSLRTFDGPGHQFRAQKKQPIS